MTIQFINNKDNKSCTLLVDHIPQDARYETIPHIPELGIDHRGVLLFNWTLENISDRISDKYLFKLFDFPDLSEEEINKIRITWNFQFK